VIKAPISQLDIFPTVAALAGAQLPPKPLDGLNIWPLPTGTVASLPQRSLFFRYLGGPPQAIRRGNFKLLTDHNGTRLYDVSGTNERVITNPAIAAKLQALYNRWDAKMVDPLWWNN
jgi:arylsulfatase A-like enzyme